MDKIVFSKANTTQANFCSDRNFHPNTQQKRKRCISRVRHPQLQAQPSKGIFPNNREKKTWASISIQTGTSLPWTSARNENCLETENCQLSTHHAKCERLITSLYGKLCFTSCNKLFSRSFMSCLQTLPHCMDTTSF